jgi:RimJ/RimL family protein N-acetyltransferase
MEIPFRGGLLRLPRPGDEKAFAAAADDPGIWDNLAMTYPNPYTPSNALEFFDLLQEDRPPLRFLITIDGQPVGAIGLHRVNDAVRGIDAELGYWLARNLWGRGIGTAAVRAITRHAFSVVGLERVHATVFEGNVASCRVLEKAGYRREGLMRAAARKNGKLINMHLYARIATDPEPEESA